MPTHPLVFRTLRSFLRPLHIASLMMSTGVILVVYAITGFITADQTPVLAASFPPHAVIFMQVDTGGQQLFEQRCSGCHTIGGGVLVGPDLKDITQRVDVQWIKNFITNPANMIATDPTAQQLRQSFSITMPTLGLTSDQIDQVVTYLSNPGSGAGSTTPTTMPVFPAGVGDPLAGRQDYLGLAPLTYGGPACIACHNVSGAAPLGGGALGPDLTHVISRLGEAGVASALQTIAFPTMAGPFLNRPLTIQEQADLVAFLKDANLNQPPTPVFAPGTVTTNTLLVFGIGLGGAVLLFGLLFYLWRRIKKRRAQVLIPRKA